MSPIEGCPAEAHHVGLLASKGRFEFPGRSTTHPGRHPCRCRLRVRSPGVDQISALSAHRSFVSRQHAAPEGCRQTPRRASCHADLPREVRDRPCRGRRSLSPLREREPCSPETPNVLPGCRQSWKHRRSRVCDLLHKQSTLAALFDRSGHPAS